MGMHVCVCVVRATRPRVDAGVHVRACVSLKGNYTDAKGVARGVVGGCGGLEEDYIICNNLSSV